MYYVKKARKLRKSMTRAELFLWSRLRRKQLGGFRFRRQHPIGEYIADFACCSVKLVVEVDGTQHDWRVVQDKRRTEWLEGQGWTVLRFENQEVFDREQEVLDRILGAAVQRVGE